MNTGYLHRIPKLWNIQWKCKFEIEYEVSDIFLCYFFSCSKHQKIMKLPTSKDLEPTKYPREKIGDPWTTHEDTMGTRPTRPTMARDPLNLAHSYLKNFVFIAWPILQWQIWIQVISQHQAVIWDFNS